MPHATISDRSHEFLRLTEAETTATAGGDQVTSQVKKTPNLFILPNGPADFKGDLGRLRKQHAESLPLLVSPFPSAAGEMFPPKEVST